MNNLKIESWRNRKSELINDEWWDWIGNKLSLTKENTGNGGFITKLCKTFQEGNIVLIKIFRNLKKKKVNDLGKQRCENPPNRSKLNSSSY